MKTRKSKATNSSQTNSDAPNAIQKPEEDPVKLLLLPSNASPDARICTLAHPANSKLCRYFICPKNGVHEFQRIAAPKKGCRSWLLGPKIVFEGSDRGDNAGVEHNEPSVGAQDQLAERSSPKHSANGVGETESCPHSVSQGHTIKEPELFVATPLDPLFLILPSLYTQVNRSSQGLFLSLDDLLEEPCDRSKHFRHVIGSEITRSAMQARMAAVCDTVEAGDETMYRLDMDKLTAELLAKAKRMTSKGLPVSMETKFVAKALETPVMSLKREESSISLSNVESSSGLESQSTNTTESQSSTVPSESTVSMQTDVTIPDQPSQPSVPENVQNLLRLRTALYFIINSYLPPSLASSSKSILSSPSSPIDFTTLDTHLSHIAKLRTEAQASRSLSDSSRKRSMVDDEEAAEAKAEKRRKKEEEEKKQKAGLTKGIRELKKVDVSGMKKMSDFFGKSSAAKKK
ncbi:MAG: hypothetical protein Q9225_004018 [Loekoesia sp. 1 TL-2023]